MGEEHLMDDGIKRAVIAIKGYLREANDIFVSDLYRQSTYANPPGAIDYYIGKAFTELLIIFEYLNLKSSSELIRELHKEALNTPKRGLHASEVSVDGEHYLKWPEKLDPYIDALTNLSGAQESDNVEPFQLIEIVRNSINSITNIPAFKRPPRNEKELHLRMEIILKPYYPYLLNKPTIRKTLKNFQADAGIPSLKTLIEYKYISNNNEAKKAADQILADKAGYESRHWRHILFIIYETIRLKSEKEWNQLLKDCGITNAQAVVLHGFSQIKAPSRNIKEKIQRTS